MANLWSQAGEVVSARNHFQVSWRASILQCWSLAIWPSCIATEKTVSVGSIYQAILTTVRIWTVCTRHCSVELPSPCWSLNTNCRQWTSLWPIRLSINSHALVSIRRTSTHHLYSSVRIDAEQILIISYLLSLCCGWSLGSAIDSEKYIT